MNFGKVSIVYYLIIISEYTYMYLLVFFEYIG